MKKVLILTLLAGLPLSAMAESAHIADDVPIFMNSGPSNKYRINGRVSSGDAVSVLARQDKYVQIKTSSGRVGWVPAPYVVAGASELAQMPDLKAALEASKQKIATQQQEIQSLTSTADSRKQESEQNQAKVAALQKQIADLKVQISNMDQSNLIRWLTHGGLVALGGVLLGLLIPYLPKRRKARNDWF